ncbi:MAG TPA: arylsulfatase [Bryobacterales bacterium]|nr:arylsulfatase [Bryobacterales bacterium]
MWSRLRFWGAVWIIVSGVAAAGAQPKPNFVFLFADDLGYGDLASYGHPTIRTPNLDRMAAEGMRFTQFYSAANVCTPSRAALLTGRLPIRSGLTRVLFPYSKGGIPDSEVTIAELLKGAGYATACIGKWHLGHLPQYLPTRHGFDRYFGLPYSNDMTTAHNPRAARYNPPPLPLMRGERIMEEEPDQRYLTRRYTEEAVKFIREAVRRRRPFFLYLPYTMPHVPLFASERFRGKSPRGLYGDAVEEIDWSVGEILRALKETGVEENTLVMFSSDNGPWLTKELDGGSAGLLREGKATTWEGGHREPFIAYWPGHVPAGVTTQAFGTMMDVLPTLASLAGVKPPEGLMLDGADLSGVLLRNETGREPLFFYYFREEVWAVRRGPWKLHVKTREPASGKPEAAVRNPPLLYHLGHDPGEQYDVAAGHPDVVEELRALITKHVEETKPGEPQR